MNASPPATPFGSVVTSSRPFVPATIDATRWESLEPLYRALLTRTLTSAGCLQELILDRSELDAAAGEAEANLYINMTRHTDVEPAQQAFATFVDQVEPQLKRVGFELDRLISQSPFAKDLDQERYAVLLRRLRRDVELFRDENVPLQTELTKLDQEYSKICGAMTVEFDGRTQTLAQMARYLEEPDRSLRERAWRVIAERRLVDADRIDELYGRMIALRHQMALHAGFESFRDFQHQRFHRFDYTPQDCITFQTAVERACVPLMRELNSERAAALGVDRVRPWDLAVDPKGRPPLRPFRDAKDLLDRTRAMFERMDAGLAAMFDSLQRGDSLDLESRPGKAPGGYQYQRQRSRQPFIFMNAAGLHRDVVTMVHEAGHAFHSLLCVEDPLVDYRSSPIEFAEVASTSMELFTLPYLDAFYNAADADRARRERLEKFPTLMPWIAQIDAFQHWVYTRPTHTKDERRAAWASLNERFSPEIDWTGIEQFQERSWQRQLHLFGMPFYYIEYGIAETGAMQLWLQSLRSERAAIENYRRGLSLGGSRPLPELWTAAGCTFDFSERVLGELMRETRKAMAKLPA
ncbi:MAG: M3 family oligoendopeptidase [Phycisphaerae bacterium]|nr:M3 family oligoendopeptidase [Phycisphaerae bacterium]